MEIIVSLQVKVCIADNGPVPIESLVSILKDRHIEAGVLEQILVTMDTNLVDSYCGARYSKRTGEERYVRAGTSEKRLVTSIGLVTIRMNKVRDTIQKRTRKPLVDRVQFAGKQLYQPDVLMVTVDFAQKLSYRDTVEELSLVIPNVPSRMTINKRVVEFGESIKTDQQRTGLPVAMADGTKSHSQEPGMKQNDIHVVLGIGDGRKVLLGITVNQSWKSLTDLIDSDGILSETPVIVSDGEPELKAAFEDENTRFQTDLIHGFRILGYKLWEDNALNLKERKEIINELKALLLSLKNVVVFHKSEPQRIGEKINQVVDGMESLANRLKELDCPRSATFLNTYSNTLVTFARLSLAGIDIPWNSNMIERLMGEIAKRVKHKWMRWTTKGLEAILKLILVRYTSPWLYRSFRNDMMGLHTVSGMSIEVSINTVSL
jgi:transposase-like protein